MTHWSWCAFNHPQALLNSFSNLRDVGIVQVKVMRAEGLMAADVNGNPIVSPLYCTAVKCKVKCDITSPFPR